VYNEVFDKNLVTSSEDREAARLAQDLEKKAKLEEKVSPAHACAHVGRGREPPRAG
jgi:hypothetical protein